MGTLEKEAILAIKDSCKQSLISTWNRIHKADIKHSFDCRPDLIHISVPVSKAQIHEKLRKDETWLKKNMIDCVQFAREKGYQVSVGFEDASRAELDFMIELGTILKRYEVRYLRFADTVGILTPASTAQKIKTMIEYTGLDIEFHAHNDLGMAAANSISAAKAGAKFIDTTIAGIGERTGNCDFSQFIYVASTLYDIPTEFSAAQTITKQVEAIMQNKKE